MINRKSCSDMLYRNFWVYLIEPCKLAYIGNTNRAAQMHGLSSQIKLLAENLDFIYRPMIIWVSPSQHLEAQ